MILLLKWRNGLTEIGVGNFYLGIEETLVIMNYINSIHAGGNCADSWCDLII